MNKDLNRYRGCLIGLAVGDALGTAVEFKPRGSFPSVTGMQGGGPFHLEAGQWTDDTSMALCLAASLIEKQGFDADDQMQRYLRWYEDGYYSSTGECFDIGNATRAALENFKAGGKALSGSRHPASAGNGSLMRLAPIPMVYAPDRSRAHFYAARSSRTTHGAQECVDACVLFADMIVSALLGLDRETILGASTVPDLKSEKVRAIQAGGYRHKTAGEIRGSGYVVDALEAALWCFWTTDTYASAVLAAVNLGDDADTTAAICGQIAGAYYGLSGIPTPWLETLHMREEILRMADQLAQTD